MSTFKISENIDSKADGVSNAGKNILPKSGDILPFAGTVAPDGWLICDGTNGTPDLRGYFTVGATSSANIGQDHGSANHTHNYLANTLNITTTFAGSHGYNAINTGTNYWGGPDHGHSGTQYYGSGDAGSNLLANSGNAGGPISFVNRPHSHSGAVGVGSGPIAQNWGHSHNNNAGTVNLATYGNHGAGHNTSSPPSGTLSSASHKVPFISMNYIVKI